MRLRSPLSALLFAALALTSALAGCGDGDAASPATAAAPPATAPAHFLTATDLRRDLANGFREGLYRLAVMSQPADDAADLGQDLPTGGLRAVACTAAAPRPAGDEAWSWRCGVSWHTVDGADRMTRYRVRLLPTGCFAAGAVPRLPNQRDTTIASYSEHPLNAIVSVRKGC